jgi:hypothetical protein
MESEEELIEIVKKAAEYIVSQVNDHIFEENIQDGFTCIDNLYVSYLKNGKFTALTNTEDAKYIILFFRIMTKHGKLWNAQQFRIIDVENSKIIEPDLCHIDFI